MTTAALVFAIYGAGLSTVLAILGVRNSRPKLVVSCHFGYTDKTDDDAGSADIVPVIIVEAMNVRSRPVEVRRAGFTRADNGEEISRVPYKIEPPDTTMLKDGESMRFHYRTDTEIPVEKSLVVDRACVSGGRNRMWYGRPDQWLRPLRIAKQWPDV